MSKSKLPLVRLSEMKKGESGVFFAQLVERARSARKDGKPFYTCRFRDNGRTVTFMAWSDKEFVPAVSRAAKSQRCDHLLRTRHPIHGCGVCSVERKGISGKRVQPLKTTATTASLSRTSARRALALFISP